MKHSELKKQFVTSLRGVSDGRHSIHTLFSDWLEIAAIALHQLPYQSGDLAEAESAISARRESSAGFAEYGG